MRRISLLFGSLVLSACTHQGYTPDDEDMSIPKNWTEEDNLYTNSETDLLCLPWWQQFKDPTLDALIDEGLLHNNTVQMAMANIEAAEGELTRVQLKWIPEASLVSGYSSWPDLGFPGVVISIVPTYAINIFKQLKEQKRAQYELDATHAIHEAIKLTIMSQIAASYFSYIGQTEQLDLLYFLEQDLSKLMTLSEDLHQGGLYSKIQVDVAKTELSLIKAREQQVKHNIVMSQNSIHYLLNKNPGELTGARPFHELSGEQMIIGDLPFNIIENRPDMKQAKAELEASNEGIGIAFSHLLPTVEFRFAQGEIATVPSGWELGQHFDFNEGLIEIPILKASVYGEMAKEKGLNKASYYRYSDTLRNALREVSDDLSAHALYTEQLNDVLEAERNLKAAYELHDSLYQRGIISYLELLKERILLTELSIRVNQYKLEQFITIVNLYRDLAVGYNYTPSEGVCHL